MNSAVTTTARPMAWQVLALALPALAQQYLFFFIQNYDQYLARAFSSEHKAALTTANYLYWFVSSYSVVVSAGATAVVGRLVGAKESANANRASGQALLLACLFGMLGVLMALPGLPLLMDVVKLDPASVPIAVQYLTPLIFILPIQMIETGGIACLVGSGDTRTGLMTLLAVALVNCPVAYGLSTGAWGLPNLGFTGIAIGTACAHTAGGVFVLTLLLRGRSGLRIRLADVKPDIAMMKRLLRVSVPAAFDSLSVAVCQFWFLRIVNALGPVVAAGHGIALRWEGLGYLSGAAFSAAGASLVARNLGAKQPETAARGGWTAFGIGALVMTIWGVVFGTLAPQMSGLYVEESTADHDDVIAGSVTALRTIAVVMPWLAGAIIFTGSLRAAGDSRFPVVFTWIGFLGVRIPLGYLLTGPQFGLGIFGVWLAMNADIVLRGSLLTLRFWRGRWKEIAV